MIEGEMTSSDRVSDQTPSTGGATACCTLSTIGFTLMFAVWLMFGVLGKPIPQEFGLTEVQLSWISPWRCSTARCGGCRPACWPTASADARS
jgi:hypothetical protein